MQSIRSRILIWLLRNRNLFKLQFKREVIDEHFSVPNFRKEIDEVSVKMNKRIKGVEIIQENIDGMNAEWIIPPNAPKDKVILYIHGGGFISGSCLTHRFHVSKFVKGSGIKALLFDYRLAPEHPFPAAHDDTVLAYKWLLKKGYSANNIVIGGESAGGNLALTSLLDLKDHAITLPAGAFSISPVTDITCSAPSFDINYKNDIAPKNSWSIWTKMYIGQSNPKNPYLSPLEGNLEDLPPILLFVGSFEIHLDDAIDFNKKALQSKNNINFKIWKNMVHAFPILSPLFPEAKQAMKEICEFIQSNLAH